MESAALNGPARSITVPHSGDTANEAVTSAEYTSGRIYRFRSPSGFAEIPGTSPSVHGYLLLRSSGSAVLSTTHVPRSMTYMKHFFLAKFSFFISFRKASNFCFFFWFLWSFFMIFFATTCFNLIISRFSRWSLRGARMNVHPAGIRGNSGNDSSSTPVFRAVQICVLT